MFRVVPSDEPKQTPASHWTRCALRFCTGPAQRIPTRAEMQRTMQPAYNRPQLTTKSIACDVMSHLGYAHNASYAGQQ